MNDKIAFFIPAMYGGGAERVVLNLLEGMTKKELPLDLVVAAAEGPYMDRIPETVNLVDLKAGRIVNSILPLIRYLQTSKPRVLISHLNHANVIALMAGYLSRTNIPVVVVAHNTLSMANVTQKRGKVVKPMMKWLYPHASAVATVSLDAARDMEQELGLPTNSVRTIYNPIVDERLFAQAEEAIAEEWLQPNSPPVYVSIGRLTEQKDFVTLLQSFALVREKVDARLIILGEGELRPQLTALIQQLGIGDAVALPGFVKNPYPYLKAASAFVLSSRWEGLPTVLIEAMACGCPVIATDCPSGPREILERERYGILIPVGDVSALAEAMIRVLDCPTEAELLIERSQDFAVERSVSEYLKLIESIC